MSAAPGPSAIGSLNGQCPNCGNSPSTCQCNSFNVTPLFGHLAESTFKLNWNHAYNGIWILQQSDSVATREGTQTLFQHLLVQKEAVTLLPKNGSNQANLVPDYDFEPPSWGDQRRFLKSQLMAQLELASTICMESDFFDLLRKRLLVLHRITYGVHVMFHTPSLPIYEKNSTQLFGSMADPHPCPSQIRTGTAVFSKCKSPTSTLVEVGVRTGLSLFFSLIRLNLNQGVGQNQSQLCSEVFQTMWSIVWSLPPLSLAQGSRIPDLGHLSLEQVTRFLEEIVASMESDLESRGLAAEILLGLAIQRGNAYHFIKWTQLVLLTYSKSEELYLKRCVVEQTLNTFSEGEYDFPREIAENVSFYDGAMIIIGELVALSLNQEPKEDKNQTLNKFDLRPSDLSDHNYASNIPPSSMSIPATSKTKSKQENLHFPKICFTFQEKQDTISLLRELLSKYGLDYSNPICAPFQSITSKMDFAVMCLKLLNALFSQLVQGKTQPSVSYLEDTVKKLRELFFQMLDMDLPTRVQDAVSITLRTGGKMLLPSLQEKLKISLNLLNDVSNLTRGQSLLCHVIFSSLDSHEQVANILGLKLKFDEPWSPSQLDSAEELISRILKVLAEEVEKRLSFFETAEMDNNGPDPTELCVSVLSQHLQDLLTTLQTHLFGKVLLLSSISQFDTNYYKLLESHLRGLISISEGLYRRMYEIFEKKPEAHTHLASIIYVTVSGSMLSRTLHLMLLPSKKTFNGLLNELVCLLMTIQKVARILPEQIKQDSFGNSHRRLWSWFFDMEKACTYLIGQLIGDMMKGPALTEEESQCRYWLKNQLFSRGLEIESETEHNMFDEISSILLEEENWQQNLISITESHNTETKNLFSLIMPVQLEQGSQDESFITCVYDLMIEHARSLDWDTSDIETDHFLNTVSRILLITLFKHTGVANQILDPSFAELRHNPNFFELFTLVFHIRSRLFVYRQNELIAKEHSGDDHNENSNVVETPKPRYEEICKEIIQKCLILLLYVNGPSEDEVCLSEGSHYDDESSRFSPSFPNQLPGTKSSETFHTPESRRVGRSKGVLLVRKSGRTVLRFVAFELICNKRDWYPESLLNLEVEQNGYSSDPHTVIYALLNTKHRAELRIEALSQLLELMTNLQDNGTSGSSVAQEYFIAGCFQLGIAEAKINVTGNTETLTGLPRFCHYLDRVESASYQLQEIIVNNVHKAMTWIVSSIQSSLTVDQSDRVKFLLYLFTLSGKLNPKDVLLLVLKSDLLPLLEKICMSENTEPHVQAASRRLLQMISLATAIHADQLVEASIERVSDVLFAELQQLMISLRVFYTDGESTPTPVSPVTPSLSPLTEVPQPVSANLQFNKLPTPNESERCINENRLGDFFVFLRRLVSPSKVGRFFGKTNWIKLILSYLAVKPANDIESSDNFNLEEIDVDKLDTFKKILVNPGLRPRLLGLQLLESLLVHLPQDSESSDFKEQIVKELLLQLQDSLWVSPVCDRLKKNILRNVEFCKTIYGEALYSDAIDATKLVFEATRTSSCFIEAGQTLVHGRGGRGFGLGNIGFTSGCNQWKFLVVKESRGNEGTCVGLSKWPIQDQNHRTSEDMWLYRAYSGNLYHKGEFSRSLPSFTQGDYITVVLDMDNKTISFGKNGDEPQLAFQGIDATEVYPCVLFYSTNPGEKVKMTDYEPKSPLKTLLTAEPYTSPVGPTLAESYVTLLRSLHASMKGWTKPINDCLMERLNNGKDIIYELSGDKTPTPSEDENEDDLPESDLTKKLVPGNFEDIDKLCREVWPALAVIGGVDSGILVGRKCIHKASGKKGIILGTMRKGANSVKVQWEDSEFSIGDTLVSSLEPCPLIQFNPTGLSSLTADVVRLLTKLTGITDEIHLPSLDVETPFEVKISCENPSFFGDTENVNDDPLSTSFKCISGEGTKSALWETSLKNPRTPISESRSGATLEALSTQMVTNIIQEVTRNNLESSNFLEVDGNVLSETLLADKKKKKAALELEKAFAKMTFLQMGALKSLSTILCSSTFAELILVPKKKMNFQPSGSDSKTDDDAISSSSVNFNNLCSKCGKLISNFNNEGECPYCSDINSLQSALSEAFACIVNASVRPCKLLKIVPISELERLHSVIHHLHVKDFVNHFGPGSGGSSTLSNSEQTLNRIPSTCINSPRQDSGIDIPDSLPIPDRTISSYSDINQRLESFFQEEQRRIRGPLLSGLSSRSYLEDNTIASIAEPSGTYNGRRVIRVRQSERDEPSEPGSSNLPSAYRGRGSLLRNNPGLVRRRIRRSPSPPSRSEMNPFNRTQSQASPPRALPTPLLEMGFSPRHIRVAMNTLGVRSELSVQAVGQLAHWMLEHPNVDVEPDVTSNRNDLVDESQQVVGSVNRWDLPEDIDSRTLIPRDLPPSHLSLHPCRTDSSALPDFLQQYRISNLTPVVARNPSPVRDREETGFFYRASGRGRGQRQQCPSLPGPSAIPSSPLSSSVVLFRVPVVQILTQLGERGLCSFCCRLVRDINVHFQRLHQGCGISHQNAACGDLIESFYWLCASCYNRQNCGNSHTINTNNYNINTETCLALPALPNIPSHSEPAVADSSDELVSNSVIRATMGLPPKSTSEEFNNLLLYLGLSSDRPYPKPVVLDELDPLGAKFVDKVIEMKSRATSCVNINSKSERSISELAMNLQNPKTRMLALKNSISVAQVMLARNVLMQALTMLSVSEVNCDSWEALQRIGLTNVHKLINLMCLTAKGRVPTDAPSVDEEINRYYRGSGNKFGPGRFLNLPYDIRTCTKLLHMSKAVEVLVSHDPKSATLVMDMAARELIYASVGFIKIGTGADTAAHGSNFVVTMALVNLLCSNPLFHAESSNRENFNPIFYLVEALAQCVMSQRLAGCYRQWCAEQLVRALSHGVTRNFLQQQLHRHPCFKSFLSYLPVLMKEQYEYEKQKIDNGDQLVFTRYMQALATLALNLNLEKDLATNSALQPNSTAEKCPWEWLNTLGMLLKTAEALVIRGPLPIDFLEKYRIDTDQSIDWSLEMDSQVVAWATQNPTDWQFGGISSVYCWGNGRHGQLGDAGRQVNIPKLSQSFAGTEKVICGQNCTFLIQLNGNVLSIGEGSYGRLGHGNSDDMLTQTLISGLQGYVIVDVATSCGSDGHTLALAEGGEVFSWGDGDYGKLGHGQTDRQRRPKQIESLRNESIVQVAVGYKHSCCLTDEGTCFMFGSSEFGRLGLGTVGNKKTPELLTSLLPNKIGFVALGLAHTIFVSADGNTVWACGCGENGKLGIGASTAAAIFPTVIETLKDIGISKVCCGAQFTVFLTKSGRVYSCGLEKFSGHPRPTNRPTILPTLLGKQIVDIDVGAEHTLCVSSDGDVFGWGGNADGQLGLGHASGVREPERLPFLSGKQIQQVSAGRTHSAAWTTLRRIRGRTFHSELLGTPSSIPDQYPLLQSIPISCLKARLKILLNFNDLLFSTWNLLPLCCPIGEKPDIRTQPSYSPTSSKIRSILSPRVTTLPFIRTVSRTMVHNRTYGPQIQINRLSGTGMKRKPIFTQVANQVTKLPPEELRLANRAWKVKLMNEGADDAGGVFDDTITDICNELTTTLPYLIPTPNSVNDVGGNRDRFLLNPDLTSADDLKAYKFIGILFGVAIRTKKPIPIPLADMMWKILVGEEVNWNDLEQVDLTIVKGLRLIQDNIGCEFDELSFHDLIPLDVYVGHSSNGKLVPIVPGGRTIPLCFENRLDYVEKVVHFRLHEFDLQISAIREGMAGIIPVPLLSLMTGSKLEQLVVGLPNISISLLKQVVRYREMDDSEELIQWLWSILEESFTNAERVLFMKFVSGRSRLPANLSDFSQRFQVMKVDRPMDGLPTAQTCFFQLRLPPYSSKDIMKERLRYAINNCTSIDMDNYMLARNAVGGGTLDEDDELYMIS